MRQTNARDQAKLRQEQARMEAVAREVARRQQTEARSPAAIAGGYDAIRAEYGVQVGEQTAQARSITTGGIAPGDRVAYQSGSGTIDAMNHPRPAPPPAPVLAEERSPQAAVLICKYVQARSEFVPGGPGRDIPATPALYTYIYAMSQWVDGQRNISQAPVPPPDIFAQQLRYRKDVYSNPGRCLLDESGDWLLRGRIPDELVQPVEFHPPDALYIFNNVNISQGQEVIAWTGSSANPPAFPRFFYKNGGACLWDEEIPYRWAIVEAALVQRAQPGFYLPGTPDATVLYYDREFWLLSSNGGFNRVPLDDAISEFTNVTPVLAIDNSGTVHISIRWVPPGSQISRYQIRHYQARGSDIIRVDQSSAWNASFANVELGAPEDDPDLDPCAIAYRSSSGINLIDRRLYRLDASDDGNSATNGISWKTLTAEDGQTLVVTERQATGETSGCLIGEVSATAEVRMPVPELTFAGNADDRESAEVIGYVGAMTG